MNSELPDGQRGPPSKTAEASTPGPGAARRRGGMMRNFMHLGFGQVATTILSILLNATMARVLTPADFGHLFLVYAIAVFVYVVVDWGHGPLIIRETARQPERSGNLMGSASVARTVGAVIATVVVITGMWLLGYDLYTRMLAGALILALLPQYIGLSFGWAFRGIERMDRDAQLNIALKVLTLVGSFICLAIGGRVLGLVLTWALAGCLTFALGVAMYRKLQLSRLSATKSTMIFLLKDGAPIFAMSLAIAVEPFFNANILYKMSSPEVVGWYGAAWTVAGTLIAPATVLGSAMYPRLSASVGDDREFKRVFNVSFRPLLLVATLAAVGTYLFAEVPIALIYTIEKFGPAADTLRAFALVLLLLYVDMFLSMALLAVGKAGRLASAKVVAVVLTTGFALLLVPLCQERFGNGGLGVMYAMAIGELLMIVVIGVLIRQYVDRRTVTALIGSVVAGAVTVLLFRQLPEFTPFLAIPLCICVFSAISLLTGALRIADVSMLIAPFRKGRQAA